MCDASEIAEQFTVQVVTLAVVGLSGSGWVDTAAIVTSVRNFPRHRGSVVGELPRPVAGCAASGQGSMHGAWVRAPSKHRRKATGNCS
jgi:Nodulin-like